MTLVSHTSGHAFTFLLVSLYFSRCNFIFSDVYLCLYFMTHPVMLMFLFLQPITDNDASKFPYFLLLWSGALKTQS